MKGLTAVMEAASFSSASQQRLTALVQASQASESEEDPMGAPAAVVYKTHSTDILDLLEDLKEKAEEEKASDTKDLEMTVKALADANSVLESIKSDCMQVAADHEATVAGRNAELKAIADAKKILEDTTSGAVTQSYSFAQVSSRMQAVVRLGAAAGEDPFVKVKGLITDLIAKLEAEASAAADEKAYCDDQIAKTEEKKSELEEDIGALAAKIDKASAASAQLKSEVKVLQGELAALANTQSEMDSVRAEQNAAYKTAVSELNQGITGVRNALTVLRDHYGSAAAAASFAQEDDSQPAKPILHTKADGAGGSIIGILEVVESDFAKELAKEEAEESDAQSLYDKTTQENKVTKTMKTQDVVYKTQEFKSLDK